MPAYALISSATEESGVTLTEHEYNSLKNVLRLMRSRSGNFDTLEQQILLRLPNEQEHKSDLWRAGYLLEGITEHFTNTGPEVLGGFVAGGPKLVLLNAGELETVLAVAAVVKTDSWMGSWFACQAYIAAEGKPHPTPMQIMKLLLSEVDEFEASLATTRRTLALFPRLFPGPTQEEHAAPGK